MIYLDESEIRKTISLMKPNDELFEIRVISKRSKPLSGYFKSADALINELRKQNLKGANVYITLNEPVEDCYAREQKNVLMQAEKTTSDNDIYAYDWLMIDLDPKRASGVSSSDEELQQAKNVGNKIFKYMKDLGCENPLMALSGNGVHLLYRFNLSNTPENKKLMEQALKALSYLFSEDGVEVDKKNFNPSRVCKLYGTLAQKGANDEKRHYRMSKIIGNASVIKASDRKYLEKLCAIIPEPEKPQKYNSYKPSEFDLDSWLDKYGIRYTKKPCDDAIKYILDECPFDSNHKAPDSCIFKFSNGAIAFTCFHNSCSGHTWQDLRRKYEPDAYEKKREYEEKKMFGSFNRDMPPESKHIKPKDGVKIFHTAKEIIHKPRQTEEIIKTGITQFDKQFRGLRKNDATIISGQTGGAKSTLLSQIVLNAVDTDCNVAVFSGELADVDYMRWMNLQAAGKSYIESTQYDDYFNVPYKIQEKIADWLEGRFWLYNNEYGYDFNAILEQFEQMITEHKLDMLCIDNLMALDISDLSREKYEAQSRFAWRIHEMAKKTHTHIIVVCHPRKPMGLLSQYDISGSSDIVNAFDNVLFVYRRNQSFENAYSMFYGKKYEEEGTNIWHCAKARFGSVTDNYYPLFYEKETHRLKNDITENRIYKWVDDAKKNDSKLQVKEETKENNDGFVDVQDGEEFPWK